AVTGDNGASMRPLPSLLAGRIAPAVVNVLFSSVTMSVLAVDESAWIFATGDGADALPLSAVTLPRVRYHSPGNPVSDGASCNVSSSCTLPSFNCEIEGVLPCRMATKPNLADLTLSLTA